MSVKAVDFKFENWIIEVVQNMYMFLEDE